ncbi:MAG: murein hydrolase activator EnvC family protein [Deltaproteobacteria bacterium]
MTNLKYIALLFIFSGCATAPTPQVKPPAHAAAVAVLAPGPGVYHRVEKKQTLFRISKIYGIDIDELARINHISDAGNIEVGQLIFIPNRQKPKVPVQANYAGSNEDFIWPLKGRVISNFGSVSNNMLNRGMDIRPLSDKNVVASRSGKITFYSPDFYGYGRTIIIDHGDGFSSVYARNAQVFIKVGDTVRKGMVIAQVGSSGKDREEYLHFEIRKGHLPQNPKFYLP